MTSRGAQPGGSNRPAAQPEDNDLEAAQEAAIEAARRSSEPVSGSSDPSHDPLGSARSSLKPAHAPVARNAVQQGMIPGPPVPVSDDDFLRHPTPAASH